MEKSGLWEGIKTRLCALAREMRRDSLNDACAHPSVENCHVPVEELERRQELYRKLFGARERPANTADR